MKILQLFSLMTFALGLLLTSSNSRAQTIQVVECNVTGTPHTLRIGGVIANWGYMDRIEENVVSGIEDTVKVDIFFDWCGPPGCCTVYDTTFTLESSFPFYLCVNAYVDSLGAESSCLWSNDEIELFNTLCLSADQILTVEDYSKGQKAKLYPNPTDRFLSIEPTGLAEQDLSYIVRDMNGREVLSGQIEREPFRLDLGGLSSGVFVLELRSDKGVLRRKFVKSE